MGLATLPSQGEGPCVSIISGIPTHATRFDRQQIEFLHDDQTGGDGRFIRSTMSLGLARIVFVTHYLLVV